MSSTSYLHFYCRHMYFAILSKLVGKYFLFSAYKCERSSRLGLWSDDTKGPL